MSKFSLLPLCATVAVAALLPAAPAVAGIASQCTGFFSSAPSVCGQVQVAAYGPDFTPASVQGDGLLQIGQAPVAGHAAVGGTGILGSAAENGDYGTLHASAMASDMNPRNGHLSQSFLQANTGFVDGFTVGSTNVEARVTVAADGSFGGAGFGNYFGLDNVTPYRSGFLFDPLQLTLASGLTSISKTYDLVFLAGDSYVFYFGLEADADADVTVFGGVDDSVADLSNTGKLRFDPVTPGMGLTFLSGHDYRTDAGGTDPTGPADPAPGTVPEPPTWAILALGLGVAGGAARSARPARSRRTTRRADGLRAVVARALRCVAAPRREFASA